MIWHNWSSLIDSSEVPTRGEAACVCMLDYQICPFRARLPNMSLPGLLAYIYAKPTLYSYDKRVNSINRTSSNVIFNWLYTEYQINVSEKIGKHSLLEHVYICLAILSMSINVTDHRPDNMDVDWNRLTFSAGLVKSPIPAPTKT